MKKFYVPDEAQELGQLYVRLMCPITEFMAKKKQEEQEIFGPADKAIQKIYEDLEPLYQAIQELMECKTDTLK